MEGDSWRRPWCLAGRLARATTLSLLISAGSAAALPVALRGSRAPGWESARRMAQAAGEQGQRPTRTVVLRPQQISPGAWTESGTGFGEITEPEAEEADYYSVAHRHRLLTATLAGLPSLSPGEIVTHATLHALVGTGARATTVAIDAAGVAMTVPRGSEQMAWHVANAGAEGNPPESLQQLSAEVTRGKSATIYSVYVVLTVESERARFTDSHGQTGQADETGDYESATDQALPAGETMYVSLLTRGAHGASSFSDGAGNTWNLAGEALAGGFVCQLWSSRIEHESDSKATSLKWTGLPSAAPVYDVLVGVEGQPTAVDALDVSGAGAAGPAAHQVQASTTGPTRTAGDFALAIAASTAGAAEGGHPIVAGWPNPPPTQSSGANIAASLAFQTLPQPDAPLTASASESAPGEMALFVFAVKVLG